MKNFKIAQFLLACCILTIFSCNEKPIVKEQSILNSITPMAQMVLIKYNYAQVLEFTRRRKLIGQTKMLLVISGEAEAGINDFKSATIKSETDSTVTIVLPKPTFLSRKINHDKSKVWDIKGATWMSKNKVAGMINEAFQNAEAKIEEAAIKDGIIEQARQNGLNVLTQSFSEISGKKVTIEFQ